jgi:hypothetical protein
LAAADENMLKQVNPCIAKTSVAMPQEKKAG